MKLEHKKYGIENFLNKNYDNAIFHFSLALQENLEDFELQTYLNLANLAKKNENEAISLFNSFRHELKDNFFDGIEGIEERIDEANGINFFDEEFLLEHENGINFRDFLYLVEKRGSFKKAFEDIMFCTKVFISRKQDFLHFLNLLIDNGFNDMALGYLENASFLFPNEPSLQDLAKRIKL